MIKITYQSFALTLALGWHTITVSQNSLPSQFTKKRFSLNIKNAKVTDAIELIAKHGELKAEIDPSVSGNISFVFDDKTLQEGLSTIAQSEKLKYEVKNKKLIVWSEKENSSVLRAPSHGVSSSNHIYLKFLSANDLHSKLKSLLGKNESIIVDQTSNSVAVYSSQRTFDRIKNYIQEVDRMPQQVLIEAQIIEIKKNKSRELGINYGDVSNINLSKLSKPTGLQETPGPQDPFGVIAFGLGSVAGRVLEARISMAESEGDAKVISRPKIITLNNVEASINSGITFNVKTLSTNGNSANGIQNGVAGQGGLGQVNQNINNGNVNGNANINALIAGGIQQITAGLSLNVLPSIVGHNKIRLAINVTNSEPDESTGVDGIPGIIDNSAKSTLIIENGKTAVLAGLIKNSKSKSHGGIPFLSKIPLLGALFRGSVKTDRDFETLIFLTPKIIPTAVEASTAIDQKESI